MSTQIAWGQLPQHVPADGISGSVHFGQDLSAAMFRLAPGAVVPLHHHINEEFGQVLGGTLELDVDGEVSRLVAGDGFLIPSEVWHGAVAGPDGCELLECYSPPRNPFITQPESENS